MSAVALWLLLAVPVVGGAALTVAGVRHTAGGERAAAPLAIAVSAAALVLAVAVAVARPSGSAPFLLDLPLRVGVDGLSAAMVLTVSAVTLVVLLFAAAEWRGDTSVARARFFGMLLLFSAAMQLTVLAQTTPALLIGWEVMGATSYALIGFWWGEQRRTDSARTAFLTTRFADVGLYIAAGAAVAGLKGPDRGALSLLSSASGGWREVIVGGVIVAAAGKSAQLPFSFWLSRAMDGPSPVSALLHSATMAAAGAYLLLRTSPLLHATGWGASSVAWLGGATAVVMGVTALLQRDFKQLLAASTCAQVGFMVLAAGSASVGGGAVNLVAHAATKALLFCAAGVWLSALGTKSLPALRGAARRWPVVGVAAGAGLLGLAGAPPFALWAAKDAALGSVAQRNVPLYVVALLGAALSAAYSGKALVMLWGPPPVDPESGFDTEQPGTRRVDRLMTAPLVVFAVAALGLVMLALPPLDRVVLPHLGGGGASASALLLSGALSLVVLTGTVLVVRHPFRVRTPRRWAQVAGNWWGLERAALLLVARPTMALARGAAWCDEHVVDGAVRGVAGGVMGCARGAARWGEAGIDGAVRAVGDAAARAGRWARRPQTGQLHQYYAQALVVLGAVVVLLLVVR